MGCNTGWGCPQALSTGGGGVGGQHPGLATGVEDWGLKYTCEYGGGQPERTPRTSYCHGHMTCVVDLCCVECNRGSLEVSKVSPVGLAHGAWLAGLGVGALVRPKLEPPRSSWPHGVLDLQSISKKETKAQRGMTWKPSP